MLNEQTVNEYNDYLISNLAYNMVNILTTFKEVQIFQRLSKIEGKDCEFTYEFEVMGEFLGIEFPLGKVPLCCNTYDKAIEQESKIKTTIENLIEKHSGIKTLEKIEEEEKEKDNKKSIFKVIK